MMIPEMKISKLARVLRAFMFISLGYTFICGAYLGFTVGPSGMPLWIFNFALTFFFIICFSIVIYRDNSEYIAYLKNCDNSDHSRSGFGDISTSHHETLSSRSLNPSQSWNPSNAYYDSSSAFQTNSISSSFDSFSSSSNSSNHSSFSNLSSNY